MALSDKIKNVIIEQLGVEDDEVTLDAVLSNDLGADELDIVELVMAFEEEFGIEIADEVADEWKLVSDVVRTIEAEKAKTKSK